MSVLLLFFFFFGKYVNDVARCGSVFWKKQAAFTSVHKVKHILTEL